MGPIPPYKRTSYYTGIIQDAKRQLTAMPRLSLSEKDRKTLSEYYRGRIREAVSCRDTANARDIIVIDPQSL